MKVTLSKRIGLFVFLLPCTLALNTAVHVKINKLVIEPGDSAQSRQCAVVEEEQRNNMRSLCQKVNKRTEKEQDKADAAFDNRDKCEQSVNINAYWELNTLRCLGRRTGYVIIP